ncbi:MAG TPA: outer membrane protein assembly factor BamB [Burkholderiales bacterium]|nr:outer membrane protein assembly factor BamB [Burkholderiales bacterium]
MIRRTLLRALWMLTAAASAGCQTVSDTYDRMFSSGKPATPPSELVAIKPTATPKILWQGGAGSSDKNIFYPAPVGNVVYAANAAGEITGFDAMKGGAVAKFTAGQRISGGVGAGGGLVFAGTTRGEVLAFEPQGKAVWKAQLTGEVLAPPSAQDGVVVARSGDGRIYGLDTATGKRRWVYQRPTQVPLTVRTHAGLLIDRGAVFAGFAGGRLVALALANGNVAWEGIVATPRGATELERVADVTSPPALDGQRVCAVAFQGRVSCFDPSRGAVLWARDMSSVAGLALDARYLYVTDDKDAIVALDKASGASIWKQDKMAGRRVSGPLAFGRYVVVGDYEGYVHFLSREDGSFAARIATDGSGISAPPVALDLSSFLVQTRNGGVYAITVQ